MRLTFGSNRKEFYMVPSTCDLSTSKPVRYVIITNKTIGGSIESRAPHHLLFGGDAPAAAF
eukprot:SAG11_NODE_161_length_14021_cov_36.845065_6_plen_61_part_00